jgi:hypothetical protein
MPSIFGNKFRMEFIYVGGDINTAKEFLMKKKLIFWGIVIPFLVASIVSGCTTTDPALTNSTTFSEVVDVAETSAADLYTRINLWFVDAFKSAESVIEFSDKDSGVIKGKYLFRGNDGAYPYDCQSTITVEVKDEKYRISFASPYIFYYSPNGQNRSSKPAPVQNQAMADKITAEWQKLADDLKNNISKQTVDW